MEESLIALNTFLDQQPWWLIALGTAVILTLFRRSPTIPSSDTLRNPQHQNSTSKPVRFSQPATVETRNFEFSQAVAEELRTLLREGNKIAAIKLVRRETGLDLVGAKDLVEAIERSLD